MRTLLFVSMVVALSSLAACEKASGPKPPEVTLEQTGGGNLAPLRLAPPAGSSSKLAIVMTMGMNMAGRDVQMPPITMTAEVATPKIDKNGDITVDVSIVSAEVDDSGDSAIAGAVRQGLAKVTAFGATSVMTPRGLTRKVDFKMPADADPQFKQMAESLKKAIEQLTPIFPDEPVGVGAKWKVTQVLSLNGVTMVQSADYALISRDGDKVELDIEVTGTAKPQELKVPGTAVTAKLTSLSATGGGHLSLDLANPYAGTGMVKSHVEMALSAQGQDVSMAMDMDVVFHPAR